VCDPLSVTSPAPPPDDENSTFGGPDILGNSIQPHGDSTAYQLNPTTQSDNPGDHVHAVRSLALLYVAGAVTSASDDDDDSDDRDEERRIGG